MSHQPGLRFDIYERIVLPDEAVSIRELDGVELIPHIQVDVEGDQAVVRGHLLLEGTYASDSEIRAQEELRHLIPVEITLPLNRVSSVEEIGVEIDNFDVDLLSARTLNVTGVLSLHGLEVQSAAAGTWREEDEVVFVHTAEAEPQETQAPEEQPAFVPSIAAPWLQPPADYAARENQVYAPIASVPEAEAEAEAEDIAEEGFEAADALAYAAAEADEEPADEERAEDTAFTSAAPPAVYQPTAYQPQAVPGTIPPKREEILEDTYEDLSLLDHYEQDGEDDIAADTWAAAAPVSYEIEEDEDREKSMKIAFASKPSEDSQASDFKHYLHRQEVVRKPETEPDPAAFADMRGSAGETGPSDLVEWKKLFLSEREEQKFKRLRMVIVQKEDTIETIAKRYDRKPQELKLFNKLQELDVSAGQVIYIP